MPLPLREKGRMAKSGRSDEEFVLFLQGIPAHCRWQELKDLVRQSALHIRQAVVYDDQHGFPTGLGQIIVKNEDEAWRTYHKLSTSGWEGQSLVVTLARTCSPTRPIAGPTKSPNMASPNYAPGYSTPPRVAQNMAVPPSPVSPEPVLSTSPNGSAFQTPEYAPMINPMGMPHQPFMPIFTDPITQQPISCIPPSPVPLRHHTFGDAFAIPIFPPYSIPTMQPFPEPPMHGGFRGPGRRAQFPRKSNYGYNSQNPAFAPHNQIYQSGGGGGCGPGGPRPSPRRTIFVQNLSPATSELNFRLFVQECGATVEQSEVPVDPDTGRCKGFARLTLRTAEEAKRVVALYNGAFFMGAKIRVKIDRSIHLAYSHARDAHAPAPVAAPAPAHPPLDVYHHPVIVNYDPSASHSHSHSHSNRNSHSHSSAQTSSPSSPASASSTASEHCGPLVINGSGVGRRVVAA